MAEDEQPQDDFVDMSAKGNVMHYVVPSFPAFNAELVEVRLQWEEYREGLPPKLHLFDGFARNCEFLNHFLPAVAYVPLSFDCAFIIDVSI